MRHPDGYCDACGHREWAHIRWGTFCPNCDQSRHDQHEMAAKKNREMNVAR